MADKYNLTHEYLIQALDYDPETGIFTWKNRPREHFSHDITWRLVNSRFNGKIAGYANPDGKERIKLNYFEYKGHILAWFYVHKEWPKFDIDHKDVNGFNNSIINLRKTTDSLNKANSKRYKNNKSGYKGVVAERHKFRAMIRVNKKLINLGTYNTPQEAHAAYCKAAKQYFGEFARFE
jgi:hypothetical protein